MNKARLCSGAVRAERRLEQFFVMFELLKVVAFRYSKDLTSLVLVERKPLKNLYFGEDAASLTSTFVRGVHSTLKNIALVSSPEIPTSPLEMFSNQLCDTCNALAIEDTLQELYESLRGLPTPFHGNHGEEALAQENFRPQLWHPNLSRVSQSSQFCPLCKLALQGLRESRRQLVENTRFSGDWLEPPQDLDDDILSIPWYSETIRLEIVAVPLTDFERENIRADVPNPDAFEINVRMHAALRFTSGGGGQLSSSWDGYGEVKAELRISSPDGKRQNLAFAVLLQYLQKSVAKLDR